VQPRAAWRWGEARICDAIIAATRDIGVAILGDRKKSTACFAEGNFAHGVDNADHPAQVPYPEAPAAAGRRCGYAISTPPYSACLVNDAAWSFCCAALRSSPPFKDGFRQISGRKLLTPFRFSDPAPILSQRADHKSGCFDIAILDLPKKIGLSLIGDHLAIFPHKLDETWPSLDSAGDVRPITWLPPLARKENRCLRGVAARYLQRLDDLIVVELKDGRNGHPLFLQFCIATPKCDGIDKATTAAQAPWSSLNSDLVLSVFII
jgi:hypothetical protein